MGIYRTHLKIILDIPSSFLPYCIVAMKKFFSIDNPPANYGHCMNHGCPRSATCLRYMLGKLPHSANPFVSCLHPSHYPTGVQCPYYRSSQKVRVAWGVRYLWDDVPYKLAVQMKQTLIRYFGRGVYYSYYRKEVPLFPEEQEVIRKLFAENGVTSEPVFESYSEEYEW